MITPLDIENKKFSKQMMNGYNVEEVDDFLDDLTVDYGKNYKEITELRAEFMKEKELSKGAQLDNEVNNVVLTLENYPELKANEQFLNLQKNLTKMENQIQAARRIYNNEVEKYNNLINIFPNNMLASIFKFKSQDFYQKEEK